MAYTLSDLENYTCEQLQQIRLKLLGQLELINTRIEVLEAPKRATEKRERGRNYLEIWFDASFEGKITTELFSSLQEWFLENGNPDEFVIYSGFFIGKRSIKINTGYTEWLGPLEYRNAEGGDWWVHPDKRLDTLDEYINPPTLDELLDMFKDEKRDDKHLMEEMIKYMHDQAFCELYYELEPDEEFVIYFGHSSADDY